MPEDIRICFLGDSLVNGTGDETALGWAGRLCAQAAGRGHPVTYYNLGIRGDSTADIRDRWQAECASRLPDHCDGRVVISCGVNDALVRDGRLRVEPTASRANFRAILQAARCYSLLVVGPPPVDDEEQNARIGALSEAFREEAAMLTVPFVDLFPVLVDDEVYRKEIACTDGAHPGSTGYRRIADVIGSSPQWWFRGA